MQYKDDLIGRTLRLKSGRAKIPVIGKWSGIISVPRLAQSRSFHCANRVI